MNRLLTYKLDELNPGPNKRIVTRDSCQNLIKDPEVRDKVLSSNVTDEELYQMGFRTFLISNADPNFYKILIVLQKKLKVLDVLKRTCTLKN